MYEKEGNLLQRIDWFTIILYAVMVTLGWLSIFSTTYSPEQFEGLMGFTSNYGKQMIWIAIASVAGFVILLIDSDIYVTFSYLVYGIVVCLLIGVLFFGVKTAGARSWFELGGLRIQPAEFAKFSVALALAYFLSRRWVDISQWKNKLIVTFLVGVPMGLIVLQGDTGSALIYLSFGLVLFREGLSPIYLFIGLLAIVLFILTLLISKYIIIGGLILVIAVIGWWLDMSKRSVWPLLFGLILSAAYVWGVDYGFYKVLKPHQQQRIQVLLGIESNIQGAAYNVTQSKIAIGSGGLTGKGFLQGTQTKFNFVPEQSTDFIFCTVGEEWGFLGTFAVVALFVLLLSRLVNRAERQRSKFSRVYGYGVVSIFFVHFLINIGMTIGLTPIIGVPLPFFSYGGSNLLSFTIMLFIFLRLDADRNRILV